MGNVGPLELVIVLIIALVVFGPKRLPDIGKSVGRGMRDFRSALAGQSDAEDEAARAATPRPLPAAGEQARGTEAPTADDDAATPSGS